MLVDGLSESRKEEQGREGDKNAPETSHRPLDENSSPEYHFREVSSSTTPDASELTARRTGFRDAQRKNDDDFQGAARKAGRKVGRILGTREAAGEKTEIIDLLQKDHDEVEERLGKLVDSRNGAERRSLLKKIKGALFPVYARRKRSSMTP
jgi:hypothetical protein